MPKASNAVSLAVLALTLAGCSGEHITNSGEWTPPPGQPAPTSAPPPERYDPRLLNAHDYRAESDGDVGYYFTTPSGRWQCAILPRSQAGCQSASASALGIPDAPDTVPNERGEPEQPNAIVVADTGEAHFAVLDGSQFAPGSGPAGLVPFDSILAVAGFRCNVAETGISCKNDGSGNGFTFSSDGYTLRYTALPG